MSDLRNHLNHVRIVRIPDERCDHQAVDCDTDLVKFLDFLKAYVGDARPATRRDLNQPLFLEQHQRFAHGGAARAETSGEFDGIEVRTGRQATRSEEHTSELQSLMRNSYAVLCLNKKTNDNKEKQKKTI